LIWLVGTIAATCTAFYMTRLVLMTFFGKERFLEAQAGGEADEAHASAYDKGLTQHDATTASAGDRPRHEPGEHVGPTDHGSHGHGSHVHIPHESPRSMWIPLAVLAVLATIGGFVGVGPAFRSLTGTEHPGGRLNIVRWLDPIVWNPATHEFGRESATNTKAEAQAAEHAAATEAAHEAATGVYGDVGFNLAHAVEKRMGALATEWLFIVISLVAAGTGMGLGWLFYLKDTRLPGHLGHTPPPALHRELQQILGRRVLRLGDYSSNNGRRSGGFHFDSKIVDGIVNGLAALTRLLSRIVGGIDKYFVDGLVNTIAAFVARLMSPLFRAAQTGFAQNYALVMVLGLMIGVMAFFGSDIASAASETASAIRHWFGLVL
jgi:NADH-quinone oxidoreductase subunit L